MSPLYNVTEEKEILFQSNKLFCFGGRVNVVLMLLNMDKHIRKLCRKKYFVKKNILSYNFCKYIKISDDNKIFIITAQFFNFSIF